MLNQIEKIQDSPVEEEKREVVEAIQLLKQAEEDIKDLSSEEKEKYIKKENKIEKLKKRIFSKLDDIAKRLSLKNDPEKEDLDKKGLQRRKIIKLTALASLFPKEAWGTIKDILEYEGENFFVEEVGYQEGIDQFFIWLHENPGKGEIGRVYVEIDPDKNKERFLDYNGKKVAGGWYKGKGVKEEESYVAMSFKKDDSIYKDIDGIKKIIHLHTHPFRAERKTSFYSYGDAYFCFYKYLKNEGIEGVASFELVQRSGHFKLNMDLSNLAVQEVLEDMKYCNKLLNSTYAKDPKEYKKIKKNITKDNAKIGYHEVLRGILKNPEKIGNMETLKKMKTKYEISGNANKVLKKGEMEIIDSYKKVLEQLENLKQKNQKEYYEFLEASAPHPMSEEETVYYLTKHPEELWIFGDGLKDDKIEDNQIKFGKSSVKTKNPDKVSIDLHNIAGKDNVFVIQDEPYKTKIEIVDKDGLHKKEYCFDDLEKNYDYFYDKKSGMREELKKMGFLVVHEGVGLSLVKGKNRVEIPMPENFSVQEIGDDEENKVKFFCVRTKDYNTVTKIFDSNGKVYCTSEYRQNKIKNLGLFFRKINKIFRRAYFGLISEKSNEVQKSFVPYKEKLAKMGINIEFTPMNYKEVKKRVNKHRSDEQYNYLLDLRI